VLFRSYHLQSEENQKKLQSPDGLQEFASQLVETAVQTMQMTLPLQLPGSMIHIYNTNKSIQQQKLRSKWMGNLKEKVDSIPLTKRSPITMQQFIAKSAEGTNASTVYIDGEELAGVLNQLQIPDDQIDSVLPGVRAQMKVAIETGGDVKISIGEYMTNVGKTPVLYNALEQHVKIGSESGLASGAVSAKQTIARQESMQQDIKDAQAEMAVQEVTNAQFVREAKEIEKVVNDQLVAAGRPATEAAFAAKLVQARAVTAAAAAGITPAQWVAQHPVPTIQSQRQAAQQAPAQGDEDVRGGAEPHAACGLGRRRRRKGQGGRRRRQGQGGRQGRGPERAAPGAERLHVLFKGDAHPDRDRRAVDG
jgi:hypothetical protein